MKIVDITEDDLNRYPVWEYVAHDGTGGIVTETDLREIHEGTETVYIVATDFIFADGTKGIGYSSPQDTSGMDYVLPVLLANGRHYALTPYCDDEIEPVGKLPSAIGKDIKAIFPATMKPRVPCDGHRQAEMITDEQAIPARRRRRRG